MRVSGVLAPEFIPAGTSERIRPSAAARDKQQGIRLGFCGLPAMTCGTAPIVVMMVNEKSWKTLVTRINVLKSSDLSVYVTRPLD